MNRFWIILPVALALTMPPAFAGRLASATLAAKAYIAKKEGHSRGPGKAGEILQKGKKLLGK